MIQILLPFTILKYIPQRLDKMSIAFITVGVDYMTSKQDNVITVGYTTYCRVDSSYRKSTILYCFRY